MTKIVSTATIDKPDFLVETCKARGVTYYTPQTVIAYEWCHGSPEGSTNPRKGGMEGVTQMGRSFLFQSNNDRAQKLRGFLKGQGFVVVVKTI